MTSLIQHTQITQLKPSPFPVQAERRAHYDKVSLQELADNIKAVGLVQPIVARKVNGHLEIVAGERRWLAAQEAGLEEVPVWIRDLDDRQALEVQLVENLQREGLHELAEAEGYETLMRKHGYDIEQLVAKVGKSRSYVYARLKLTALCADARKAFYTNKISASIALLLARIPVEELQKQALKEVLTESDENWDVKDAVMSYREAAEHIQSTYMLRLKEAPFPIGDADLVALAGPCIRCPKNTAMQRELFADVQNASAGVCTDPVCFKAKRDAWGKRQLEEAKGIGRKVIAGAEAKKIAKHSHSLQGGYVKLDDRCYDDRNHRTYREILGKKAEPSLLQVPDTGDVIEVVQKSEVKDLLPKASSSSTNNSYQQTQRAEEKKRHAELAYRAELFRRVQATNAKADAEQDLRLACAAMFDRLHHDGKVSLFKVMGWTVTERKDKYRGTVKTYDDEAVLKAAKSETDLWRLLRVLCVAGDLECYSFGSKDRSDRLHKLAARLGINAKKVEAELTAAAAKPAPAKASKKKAARKPK